MQFTPYDHPRDEGGSWIQIYKPLSNPHSTRDKPQEKRTCGIIVQTMSGLPFTSPPFYDMDMDKDKDLPRHDRHPRFPKTRINYQR
jgi:hypothetical protein